ncbi:hypothetical protein GF385_04445 [Candidatus Dependentiae bacterium]|nr:hypothetical protein [Candidatus Dependentiae bacterium]
MKCKKYFYYYIPVVFFFFVGILFFLIHKDIVVVKFFWNSKNQEFILNSKDSYIKRKDIKFFYFKDDKLLSDSKKIVWFKDKVKLLKHLVNNWLSFLQEERLVTNSIGLDTVCLGQDGQTAYFSFDKYLFDSDWPIYYKWNFIESLLKTIRESGLDISSIVFLVNHKIMQDDHLDFSFAWPIGGFK